MKAELVTAYDRLMENCRAAGYAGYDPFDGLESRIFKVTPMRHFRPTRLLWQQAVKRSPINLRRIYDKGIDVTTREGVYNTLVQYRTGDMISPKLDQQEALAVGTRHFLDCIRDGSRPMTDGQAGLNVVRILEASEVSIKNQGKLVPLNR